MPSVNDMMNSVKISKTDPFNAASIFKDPSSVGRGQLSTISSNLTILGNTTGVNASVQSAANTISSQLNNYSGMIASNISSRMTTITRDLPAVVAAGQAKSTIAAVDGGTSSVCDFVDSVFGSIKNISTIISNTTAQIQSAIASVLGTIGDIFNAGYSFVVSAVNAIASTIASVLNQVQSLISNAISQLQTMINNEIATLQSMIEDLFDFSFLKSFLTLNPCGQAVMDQVIKPEKLDSSKLASL